MAVAGNGEDDHDRQIEIRVDYLSGGIASVQCFRHRYVDLLHLIDMPDGWKIVNAAWRLRVPTTPWRAPGNAG